MTMTLQGRKKGDSNWGTIQAYRAENAAKNADTPEGRRFLKNKIIWAKARWEDALPDYEFMIKED